MEKKKYIKPLLTSEEFVPQEYCSSCGTGQNVWFECGGRDAQVMPDAPCEVFRENGKEVGLQTNGENEDDVLTYPGHSFKICHERHMVNKGETFPMGYVRYNNGGLVVPILMWTGSEGDNLHCTPNLNKDTWVTAKS